MFNTEPKIRIDFRNKKRPYRLMNSVRYTDEETTFRIPRGYNYDGATIPRILWTLIGSKGDLKLLKPALVHDFMCERKKRFSVWQSTSAFYKLLIHYGTCKLKAFVMCFFVCIWQVICRSLGN